MNVTSASCLSAHTLTHTCWVRPRHECPCALVLFWPRRQKADRCPKMVSRAVERSGSEANQRRRHTDVPPCDARAGFHWRKSRRSVCSKYNLITTAALTWGYCWMKRAKNSRSLEAQTLYDWKYRRCIRLQRGGVLSHGRPGNTCVLFH